VVHDAHQRMLQDMAQHYRMPLRDMSQPRPELRNANPAAERATRVGQGALRGGGQRLAVLDSTFPWKMSGFRYSEAVAILAARPDTLFFSTYEMTDAFPAPVHALADFPEIALREGVTDAYGVFLWFLAGLVGAGPSRAGTAPHPMEGLDLSATLSAQGIRLHGTLLPGGGFLPTDEGFRWAAEVVERLDTVFAFTPEVLGRLPSAVPVPAAFTDTSFYAASTERWHAVEPFVCLFAADAPPRKGLDVVIEAFSTLGPRFHLHVVGPHEHRRPELAPALATFHGWLEPERLRDLHRRAHVFLSPVSAEAPGPSENGRGMTDGFPTQTAADAMSSGCLLLSANPLADHRVFEPGVDYVQCPPDAQALRDAMQRLAGSPETARRIARAGSQRVRERMDVRLGVAAKLEHMGLLPGTPRQHRAGTLRDR
jgi:glycosyltransferase involved in cell wall biosynthesis